MNFKVSRSCFDKKNWYMQIILSTTRKRYSFVCSKCSLITYLDFEIAFRKQTLLKIFDYETIEKGIVITKSVRHPRERLKRMILLKRQQHSVCNNFY